MEAWYFPINSRLAPSEALGASQRGENRQRLDESMSTAASKQNITPMANSAAVLTGEPSVNSARARVRVAYLLSRYPAVSHTFLLNEIRALRKLNFEIAT